MADALTQEQIDAMLQSVMSGEEIVTEPEEDPNVVKEYDFRTPKKFTKEQIKSLESIFDGYARYLSSYFTGLLRLYCKVDVVSIEEQKYYEFNNALPDYVMMAIADLGIKYDDIDSSTAIIQMSNSLTYMMIDRLLGGKGDYQSSDRDFTEIEVNIMTDIMTKIIGYIKEAWENHIETNPVLLNIETNSRVVSAAGPDDTMIIAIMEVTINEAKSIISFCMSAISLDAIMHKFSSKYNTGKRFIASREKERKDSIMSTLGETDLKCTAVLGETELDLCDVLTLQVDDIIPLNKKIDENVLLKIGETCWFDGKLGTFNNKKAFKVDNILRN